MLLTLAATFLLSIYFLGAYLLARKDFNGKGAFMRTIVILGERKTALAFGFAIYKEQLVQNKTLLLASGTSALQHYIDEAMLKTKDFKAIRKERHNALDDGLLAFYEEMNSHSWCRIVDSRIPDLDPLCVDARSTNPILYLGDSAATQAL